jgi:catechol 2,3-dioxygenase
MKPTLQLSTIALRVADLKRSLDFYVGQVGFHITRQAEKHAELSTGPSAEPILFLTGDGRATQPPQDAAGLFHAALLFPTRAALGGWLRFAAQRGVEFQGFSDHGVSEAIYFADPDGNGLEFYVDRPREQWPFAKGEVAMFTRGLDVQNLMTAGETRAAPLDGAHWGHLHLRVTNLERSDAFYRQTLGLELMQGSYPGARFLAADGYHHHLGLNVWGDPHGPQPADALGLMEATFARTAEKTPRVVKDPDGISIRIVPLAA